MTASPTGVRPPIAEANQALKRRGLLAVGAAFVAGLIAKLSETPVSAGVDGDVVLGVSNSTAGSTVINCQGSNGTALTGTALSGPQAVGLLGQGNQYGVMGASYGTAVPGAAVVGIGVLSSHGVAGFNAGGIGVLGSSDFSYSIFGQTPASSNANTIAIYAQNFSTYTGGAPGAGGFAIYGLCAKGHGLVGATATAGAAAVVGASNGVAGAYAGAFYGSVVVSGAFTVFGAKSAAVPHPDGSHRRLYCLESPESWFEDFGTGHLQCGRAEVMIDPDFAAIVDLADYHVFLTEYDTDAMLRVRHRTRTGFAVEADPDMAALKGKKESDLTGTFSWRVVAKRKDIKGERLAPVTIPPEPTLPPPVPDMSAPPPPPASHMRRR
jgi:hypothetical protein